MRPKEFGMRGEVLAARYLEAKGYEILGANYLKRSGEIDLVALDPRRNEIVFVEVKSRRNSKFGAPEESVSARKVKKMADTAEHWLTEHPQKRQEWRLDLIAIEEPSGKEPKITHIENIS